jgi:hypothetical protein
MITILHRTEIEEKGPWLISRERLEQLDKLADEEWKRLSAQYDDFINTEVKEELKRSIERHKTYTPEIPIEASEKKKLERSIREKLEDRHSYKKERTLTIHLRGNRRVAVESFAQAFQQVELLDEIPEGFTLHLRALDTRCTLTVPRWGSTLELSSSPDDDQSAKTLFTTFRKWVDEVKSPFWQQLWLGIKSLSFQWLIYVLLIMGCVFYFDKMAPDSFADSRVARQKKAEEILRAGISQTNHYAALELILSYESGAIPSTRTRNAPSWFWWLLIGGAGFCVALSFMPTVQLGIGKGEGLIKRWKLWIQMVGIAFPTWIVGTFIWPKLQAWLEKLF